MSHSTALPPVFRGEDADGEFFVLEGETAGSKNSEGAKYYQCSRHGGRSAGSPCAEVLRSLQESSSRGAASAASAGSLAYSFTLVRSFHADKSKTYITGEGAAGNALCSCPDLYFRSARAQKKKVGGVAGGAEAPEIPPCKHIVCARESGNGETAVLDNAKKKKKSRKSKKQKRQPEPEAAQVVGKKPRGAALGSL